MNVSRHDADLRLARRDDAGTIRTDETRAIAVLRQEVVRANHVVDGDSFSDANDQFNAGVGRFHHRVCGERRRNKDQRTVRSLFFARLGDCVEDGETLMRRAAFARRDAADDLRAVLAALFRVKGAFAARDPLHDDARVLVCPDGHSSPCREN